MPAGTASRTALISATRSAPDSVLASPVVPQTSTAAVPRSVSSRASAAVAAGSACPSSANMVTSATPTPVNTVMVGVVLATLVSRDTAAYTNLVDNRQ